MFAEVNRGFAQTALLVCFGAILGAITGVVCLALLGVTASQELKPGYLVFVLYMGTLVGAPLGAVGAALLGWSVLRHVPLERTVLAAPFGTLVGSFVSLCFGWVFADVGDGRGIFYLVGGGAIGLVCTAFFIRAQYRARSRAGPNAPS